MRGFIVSLTTVLVIAVLFVVIALGVSFFSGGSRSASLFGWYGQPLLAEADVFITSVFNGVVYVASWVTIFLLFAVFLVVQGIFVFAYYKMGKFLLSIRSDVEKVLDELLDI